MAKSLTLTIHTIDGTNAGSVALPAAVFGVEMNPTLVSEVTVSSQANRRRSIANALTRGEVRGGGRKPWRQKGTGRARAGSTRSPLWRHGGAVFGPSRERNFTRKINAKVRTGAFRMVLSALANDSKLYLVDELNGATLATTKQAAKFMNAAAQSARRPLVLTATADSALLRAASNLDGVMIRSMERLGFLDMMLADQLILDQSALEALTKRLSDGTATIETATSSTASDEKKPAVRRATTKKSTKAKND